MATEQESEESSRLEGTALCVRVLGHEARRNGHGHELLKQQLGSIRQTDTRDLEKG